jgi:hypothetical protein
LRGQLIKGESPFKSSWFFECRKIGGVGHQMFAKRTRQRDNA